MDADGVRNGRRQLLTDLSTKDAEALLAEARASSRRTCGSICPRRSAPATTASSARTCISRHIDGALLLELFTRDGVGTMVSATALAHLRNATIDDVGGILAIIEPLEEQGVLVRRSRERLESGDRALRRRRVRQPHHRLRGAVRVSRRAGRRAGGARRAPGFPARRLRRSADARDRDPRATAQAQRSCSCSRRKTAALVPRARLPHRRRSRTCRSRSRRSTIGSASRRCIVSRFRDWIGSRI